MAVITKILNLLIYLTGRIFIFFIHLKSGRENKDTLLIIKLDAIGDYVLFRNFLEIIRSDEKYCNKTITLCGNKLWKDLAEEFDRSFVDEFIWIDKNKFRLNLFYKYIILNKIYKMGFEIAVDTMYSREILFGDTIIKASKAVERIGSMSSADRNNKTAFFSDRFYTRLIPSSNKNLFEFDRNRDFVSKLLGKQITINKTYIIMPETKNFPEKSIVIFPGAKDKFRRWNSENFYRIAKYILSKTDYHIKICGSKNEKEIADNIFNKLNSEKVENLTGSSSLVELVSIINNADLLISNETVAPHIAAAVDTEFICISNGNHWGRFNPYPKEIFQKAVYFYPDEIMKNITNCTFLSDKYQFGSDLDIDSIKVESVIKEIEVILEKRGI